MESNIDLRNDGVLSIDLAKELTRVEGDVRKEYTKYIGDLARANLLSGLCWLVNVTSRNPYYTRIFDSFCKLRLLDLCFKRHMLFKSVLVEDQGMYDAVNELIKKHGASSTVQFLPTKESKPIFLLIRRVAISVYIMIVSFVVPGFLFLVGKRKSVPDGPIIYLDTYIKGSDFNSKGIFTDNYYSGIMENMPEKISRSIWYAPVIYSLTTFSELKWIIEKSRESNINFLIMEEWLMLSDYIYSFYMSFVLPRRIKQVPTYCGIDVSSLIFRDLSLDIFSSNLVRAILIY